MDKDLSPRPLQRMFMEVPPSYDIINRLLTFRMDQVWRSGLVSALLDGSYGGGKDRRRILDLCTGTGDLAIRLRKRSNEGDAIFALDFSRPMLEIARGKAVSKGFTDIEFIHGDASDMPFKESSFDAVGIAFALRNLTYKNPLRDLFLSEVARVLKPGGRFIAVETCQPDNMLMRRAFHFYMKYYTAPVGSLLSGHPGAYRYLAYSARNYYEPWQLKEILLSAGFSRVNYRLLFKGVAARWECIL